MSVVALAVASGEAWDAVVFAEALQGSLFTTAVDDAAGFAACVVAFAFALCGFFTVGFVAGVAALVCGLVVVTLVVVAPGTGVWAMAASDSPAVAAMAVKTKIVLRMPISRLTLREQNARDGE